MWKQVKDMFYVGNEIWGCGLGTMKSYLRGNEERGETEHFAMLHNDHLHLLIETGLVGIGILSFFAFSVIISLVRNMRNIPDKKSGRYAANFCALASFLAIVFCMFFSNILSQVWEIVVCFMFIGMAMGLNEKQLCVK